MGKRAELLGKLVTESTISPETRALLFAIREILNVQEEILEELLNAAMAGMAQGLYLAMVEVPSIPLVWGHMVHHITRGKPAFPSAIPTQRLFG